MAKVPAFAKAFAGRWRIVEMVAVSSATSTSTTATIQASSASRGEPFNGLLDLMSRWMDGMARL
jgi:hypothetical protein